MGGCGLKDVDGYTAVLLWAAYTHRGNTHALETLLAYNLAPTFGSASTASVATWLGTRRRRPTCSGVAIGNAAPIQVIG